MILHMLGSPKRKFEICVWNEIATTKLYKDSDLDGRWTKAPVWKPHKDIPARSILRMTGTDLPCCRAGYHTFPWRIFPGPAP